MRPAAAWRQRCRTACGGQAGGRGSRTAQRRQRKRLKAISITQRHTRSHPPIPCTPARTAQSSHNNVLALRQRAKDMQVVRRLGLARNDDLGRGAPARNDAGQHGVAAGGRAGASRWQRQAGGSHGQAGRHTPRCSPAPLRSRSHSLLVHLDPAAIVDGASYPHLGAVGQRLQHGRRGGCR